MSDDRNVIHNRIDMAGMSGPIWLIGWLFTVGYAHLTLPKLLFAVVLWPFYLGSALH